MAQIGLLTFELEDYTPHFKEFAGPVWKEKDLVPKSVLLSDLRVSRVSCVKTG